MTCGMCHHGKHDDCLNPTPGTKQECCCKRIARIKHEREQEDDWYAQALASGL